MVTLRNYQSFFSTDIIDSWSLRNPLKANESIRLSVKGIVEFYISLRGNFPRNFEYFLLDNPLILSINKLEMNINITLKPITIISDMNLSPMVK